MVCTASISTAPKPSFFSKKKSISQLGQLTWKSVLIWVNTRVRLLSLKDWDR
jgi:hypothetical protein